MAQFIARIQGNRGGVSRLGSKSSGITAYVQGWNTGVRVDISHEDGRDVVRVFRTGGSHANSPSKLIAEF